ncbi:MAG: ATP-grasp domain-containing protein [Candidatus Altimarinota bacterium]
MQIINFLTHETETIELLKSEIQNFLNQDTLIINDTRGMIIPSVLPFIEFVGGYDQRVLSILQNTNVIFSKPFSKEIETYYNSFGLAKDVNVMLIENKKEITLAKNISQNEIFRQEIKAKKFKKIVPFFVNEDMDELSQILEIPLSVSKEVFTKANDKLLLKKFLQVSNLPTIEGVFTSDREVLQEYFSKKERFLFKDPLGVSGYGFWDNSENSLEELLENYGEKELIIEKFIQKESSPSVQFFISEDKKSGIIFGITDQILENGKVYLGNKSPSIYVGNSIGEKLVAQSEKIIEYIAKIGYTGFGGIDFIVDINGEIYATEVNARFTGATYPAVTSLLIKSTLFASWDFYNYEGEKENIKDYLEKKSILNKDEIGIFPLGISGLETFGKANILKFN